MAIQTSVSAHSSRGSAPARRGSPIPASDTGFTVSVKIPDAPGSSHPADLVQAAQTLRELSQEWFPQAEVSAVLNSGGHVSHPAPQRPSIYDRLPAAPYELKRVHVGLTDVAVNGVGLNLSPQELNLFRCLAVRRDQVVTREHIFTCAWENQEVSMNSRTIDVHIRRLREKTQIPDLFTTVRGQGYRMNSAAATIVVDPRP